MAQKIQVLMVDDIDGSEGSETVTFGVDGVNYEIDLNEKHAGELRGALLKFAEHARKAATPAARRGGRGTAPKRGGRSSSKDSTTPEVDTNAIRDWARANGHQVKDRGRVPGNIVKEYQAATGK